MLRSDSLLLARYAHRHRRPLERQSKVEHTGFPGTERKLSSPIAKRSKGGEGGPREREQMFRFAGEDFLTAFRISDAVTLAGLGARCGGVVANKLFRPTNR